MYLGKKEFFLFLFFSFSSFLSARLIESFYGPMEIEEEVLLELIESPAFQRLKKIHQYGVSYYTTHPEEYSRYGHSIGVFAILRSQGCSLEEQIAGLLHDVSHTVFSHVGDWIFGKENQTIDYQTSIHTHFLEQSGLAKILKKYHLTISQILPREESFPALENQLPHLCADRIDYNIQGAYYQGFISYEEALLIFQDLHFTHNCWVSTKPELMKKLTRFSLFMTQNCWGSPANYLSSRWLADAILRGMELGLISYEDLHFGTDQDIWDRFLLEKDPLIQEKMKKVIHPHLYFSLLPNEEQADLIIKSKFRGIDPYIKISESQYVNLSTLDSELAQEYERAKRTIENGYFIKIH